MHDFYPETVLNTQQQTSNVGQLPLVLILCIYGSLQQSRKWCSYHLSMYSVLYCCIQETTQSCSLPTFKEYMYFFKNRDDRDFAATSQQYFSLTPNQHQPRTSTSQPTILFSHKKSAPTTSHSQPNRVIISCSYYVDVVHPWIFLYKIKHLI